MLEVNTRPFFPHFAEKRKKDEGRSMREEKKSAA
jgi:hypothetical protein